MDFKNVFIPCSTQPKTWDLPQTLVELKSLLSQISVTLIPTLPHVLSLSGRVPCSFSLETVGLPLLNCPPHQRPRRAVKIHQATSMLVAERPKN